MVNNQQRYLNIFFSSYRHRSLVKEPTFQVTLLYAWCIVTMDKGGRTVRLETKSAVLQSVRSWTTQMSNAQSNQKIVMRDKTVHEPEQETVREGMFLRDIMWSQITRWLESNMCWYMPRRKLQLGMFSKPQCPHTNSPYWPQYISL